MRAKSILSVAILALVSATASAQGTIVETAVKAGSFKTLVAAVQAAGLADTLSGKGPFTVFAPTDAAFAALPEGTIPTLLKAENKGRLTSILTYHVAGGSLMAKDVVGMKSVATVNGQRAGITVKDGKAMIGNATIVTTDIKCSNGVIHVIDAVILPNEKNLVEVAKGAGKFNTLLTAATEAGLAPALMGKGPFTVFAPSDEAFGKLAPGTISSLLKPENREKLTAILKAHVVEGRVFADQASKVSSAATIGGYQVPISAKGGSVLVGGSKVVAADIQASNGVIHVIDSVIIPK